MRRALNKCNIEGIMEPMVIKVHGVPCIPPPDRMVDQIKIHFLKRRNSGEDVVAVIYPTSTPGQAYVIFESAKVPGILEHTHILDVDNRFYPIHVKKAHLSEVDMPVETTLDLNMFPNQEPVMKLLRYYDFNVTELKSGQLQLKGSFLKLKLIRYDLMQLLGHEHQSHSRVPSAPHNGSSLRYDMERQGLDPRFVSMSVSGNLDKKDAVSQHRFFDNAPSLSSLNRDLPSGGSPESFQSSHTSYAERNLSSPVNAVGQKYQRQDNYELRPLRPSPLAYGASSFSTDSPSSLTLLQHTSSAYRDTALTSTKGAYGSQYSSIGSSTNRVNSMQQDTSSRDSASGGSLRRSPSFNDHTSTSSLSHSILSHSSPSHSSPSHSILSHSSRSHSSSSHSSPSHSKPSASSEGTASFPVDTDSFNFILTQKRDDVKKIKESFGTKMEWEEDAGVTMVTFLGKDSKKAKASLQDVIEKLSLSLRTQEINLRQYDHAEQKQILKQIQHHKDSGVMITHNDDVVKLVGSSVESFEVRQKILGHSDDHHRGRDMERSSNPKRSTSVPRHYKLADHERATHHENKASVQVNRYSPLHYQGGPDEGKAPPIVRDSERTRSKNSQQTSRSSESQKSFPVQKFTDALKLRELNSKCKNLCKFKLGPKNK